jgi:hypothetical protein
MNVDEFDLDALEKARLLIDGYHKGSIEEAEEFMAAGAAGDADGWLNANPYRELIQHLEELVADIETRHVAMMRLPREDGANPDYARLDEHYAEAGISRANRALRRAAEVREDHEEDRREHNDGCLYTLIPREEKA